MFSWRSHVVRNLKILSFIDLDWARLWILLTAFIYRLWPISWNYLVKHYCSANPPNVLSFYFPREEINSLSRQASFRRLNSVSTDPRVQVQTHKDTHSAAENNYRQGYRNHPPRPSVAGVEPLANQQPCLLQRLMITCSCSFKQMACSVHALLLLISHSGWFSFCDYVTNFLSLSLFFSAWRLCPAQSR